MNSFVPQEERKTLDRELARAKVTANRVAVVVANEWKDANDKVMPVKQWLEERRFLQVNFDFYFFLVSYCALIVLLSLIKQISIWLLWFPSNYFQTLLIQGEMQQLREKLTIAERTAKSEAQLKVMIWFYSSRLELYCMFLLY